MALLHLEGFEGIAPEFITTGGSPNQGQTMEYLRSTYHGRFESGTNFFHLRRGHDGRGMALAAGRDAAGAGIWVARYFDALATTDEIIIGFRIKFPLAVQNNREICRITGLLSGGSGEARIRTVATNALQIQYGTGTTVATTANDIYSNNGWHYIEWKTVLHNSTSGSYELRVDGVNVASGSGVRTAQNANAQATGVLLWGFLGAGDDYEDVGVMYDDWYICDNTGTLNNNFLGAIKVTHQPITLAGSNNQFSTFGGGRRDTNVNPNPDADDTVGIASSNTATNKQNFKLEPYHASNIVGVAISSRSKPLDGLASINLKHRIDSGASNDSASSVTLIDKHKWNGFYSVHEADPNTSTAWTQTTIDAAEFGVEIG